MTEKIQTEMILPEKLSKKRVALIVSHSTEGFRGEKNGKLFIMKKDMGYFKVFAGALSLPWTEERLKEVVEPDGTKVYKRETPEEALTRRLLTDFSKKAASKILAKMQPWKGLRLSWKREGQGDYYLTVYIMVTKTLGEFDDLMDDIRTARPKGSKGIPHTITFQEVKRMILVPAGNEFMAEQEIVLKYFFEALDAGTLPKEESE